MIIVFFIAFGIFVIKLPALLRWFVKLFRMIYWLFIDLKVKMQQKKAGHLIFNKYGLVMFVGRQGQGKTVSLVQYAWELKQAFPDLVIYANFKLSFSDGYINDLNDLLTIRNGTSGVLFLIDELQNEFSSNSSKNFPETLLSTITMQRKQKIHIATTSQVFTRVAKPLREQCFSVVECQTILNRWTRNKCYDAIDYNSVIESTNPDAKRKLSKLWKKSFIQTDKLRNCYDTYEVIQRISRQGFVEKNGIS